MCLTLSAPDGAQFSAVLAAGTRYTVGRSPTSDFCVNDPLASEYHAVICGGDPPTILDAGSQHGTLAAGAKLRPGVHHAVDRDSVVLIGQTVVRFTCGRPSGTRRLECPPGGMADHPSVRPSGHSSSRCPQIQSGVRSGVMGRLQSLAVLVAGSDVSVLILGETGVGKEVMAHAIHNGSQRRHRSLVSLNCAAIPENLLESELFGHERGAFSGAIAAKPGIFETADGTTLFLDEIGDLPLASQAKLLRVLDQREVRRLGALRPSRIDVRVIAATNRDLQEEIAKGRFRADLFYRLNGITLSVPPLRERVEDILPLSAELARELSNGVPPQFTPAAVARLEAHAWRGNVRELRTVLHRALLLSGGHELDVTHLVFDSPSSTLPVSSLSLTRDVPKSLPPDRKSEPFSATEPPTAAVAARLQAELETRERRRIGEALRRSGGSQKAAAELLGMSRRTLINRLERLGMPRPRKHSNAPSPDRKGPVAQSGSSAVVAGKRRG
ncbi:sigma 54-interacting transcriptional regulator [Myxococcota bacterium]